MLGDAQQAKRVRTVGQAPRFLIQIQRPSSRCAPSTTAQGMDQRAAASLLHAAAFGLRAPLAGDQVREICSCLGFSNDLCEAKSSEYTSKEVAQRS